MDATEIAKKLIKPLTDGVADLLAERVADIVSNQLKQEIFEAQKYKIDKECELKKRQQNLRLINYCPKCDQWMKQNYIAVFVCERCGLERRTDTPIQQ